VQVLCVLVAAGVFGALQVSAWSRSVRSESSGPERAIPMLSVADTTPLGVGNGFGSRSQEALELLASWASTPAAARIDER
jgi:hypothetical protein